jgi:hypothetical protein
MIWPALLLLGIDLTGIVKDARSGEPLGKARIEAAGIQVESDRVGRFRISLDSLEEIRVSLVGYRTERFRASGEAPLEVLLVPDNTTSLTVREGAFETSTESSPSERTLRAAELRNLAGVLMSDPLRAVQALPGVASSNDFSSQFSVRGAGFDRIGIYLDGVLLNSPQHSLRGQENSGSLTMINSDLIEEIGIHLSAPPVPFMDRTGSTLAMRVREGNIRGPAFRFHTGVASSGVMADGPLPGAWGKRGTWLAAFRKSYLQYLITRASDDDTLAFGFLDAQAKLAFTPGTRQHWTLAFFDGKSDLDRSRARATAGINSTILADYHFSNLQLAHRYTPNERFQATNRLAWARERSGQTNPRDLALQGSYYGEWVANSDAQYLWNAKAPLLFGSSFRRIRDEGFLARYNFVPLALRRRDPWSGTAWRNGGYIEQSGSKGLFGMSAGARFDAGYTRQPLAVSPHASLRASLGPSTRWTAAFSHAIQYAPLSQSAVATFGNVNLLPQRAIHFATGMEQSLGAMTRIRAEVFYRADRDLIAQPLLEPRLLASGAIFNPPSNPRFENSVRGSSRGWEVFLQRRTANRWNGWLSYSWARTRMRDGVTGAHYFGDWDQRHTVNAYGSYRLTSTVNLSLRHSYGSNFPIPGFLRRDGQFYALSTQRNAVRLPAFHRSDFRINKQFNRKAWRGVLYVEVMNLWNRDNRAFDAFNGYNATTGRANVALLTLFPFLPAAGWQMDWGQ